MNRSDSQEREVTQRLAAPTPVTTARPPASSSVLLEQAQKSEVSRDDVPLVTHERVKLIEENVSTIEANVSSLSGRFDSFAFEANARDLRFADQLDRFERSQNVAAKNSGAARYWSKVVAMATVAGPTLVVAFAHWGVAHPGAFGGLAGTIGAAILAIAKATTPAVSQPKQQQEVGT